MRVVAVVLAAAAVEALRAPRASLLRARTALRAAPATFEELSCASLDAPRIELKREWFETFGLTVPGPAPKKKAKKSAPKGKKGGFGAAAAPKPVFCEPPADDLLVVVSCANDLGVDATDAELAELGAAARVAVDDALPRTGAVLLRGLPMRSGEAFGAFWRGCRDVAPPLVEGTYTSLAVNSRMTEGGVDLATNVPPEFPLLCHNELCYNPETVERIYLYCAQDARRGGESLLARNTDLTTSLSAETEAFLADHGGVRYERKFYDERQPGRPLAGQCGSWQEKCGVSEKAGAEAFFRAMGFGGEDLTWDGGDFTVRNSHPGYRVDPETGDRGWWSIVHTGSMVAGDGTPFPKKLIAEVQRTGWDHTRAVKAAPGDWLICDNLRVQHGRLPYDAAKGPRRTLFTVYSGPTRSVDAVD